LALTSSSSAGDIVPLRLARLFRQSRLFDAGQDWSVKREEFRSALQQRVAKSLMIHTPKLSKKSAADIALVVMFNTKAVATYKVFFELSASSVPDEFRDLTRLYLQSRLRSLAAT
jgi:hypothetical protein